MTHTAATQWSETAGRLLLVATVDPSEIGRRIKQAREQKGWTQVVFAYQAHVSPSTVTRWESGKLPPVRELIRIAGLLAVDPDYFVIDETPVLPRPSPIIEYSAEILSRLDDGEHVPRALPEGLADDLDEMAEQAARLAERLRRAVRAGESPREPGSSPARSGVRSGATRDQG